MFLIIGPHDLKLPPHLVSPEDTLLLLLGKHRSCLSEALKGFRQPERRSLLIFRHGLESTIHLQNKMPPIDIEHRAVVVILEFTVESYLSAAVCQIVAAL